MTVEVENQEQEVKDEVRTSEQVSKDMYPDDVEEEKGQETDAKDGDETKEEDPKKEGAEEKSDEQEETKDREEESLTLTLSKDSPLDDSAVENLKEFAKANKLGSEAAQAILEREESAEISRVEKQEADLTASVAEWTKTIQDHPVYGGDKLEEATAIALRPLKKFGNEDIDTFLKETGFSNHPAVFEYHYQLGKAMGDDKFVDGEAPKAKPKSVADRMYPNEAKKE